MIMQYRIEVKIAFIIVHTGILKLTHAFGHMQRLTSSKAWIPIS
jgi:hypothetical protein